MRPPCDTPIDGLVAELAARQHGVAEHEQLRRLGLSPSAIARRVTAGRLHRIHVGVYAVGHPNVTPAGRRLAAVLACGQGAVLSHHTAADLWNIRPSASPAVHVTVPTTAGRKRPGIKVHRTRTLGARHATRVDGIPVTTVGRTLGDLARTLDSVSLRKTVERANRLRLLDLGEIERGRSRRLERALSEAYLGSLRSSLESDFIALCRAHRIPIPETNVLVAGYEVDFLWRDERVIVETDGWAYHGDPRSFREDRRRDAELALLGFVVVRYAHDQVDGTGATQVAALLAQRKPRRRNQ